ncbi:hypothetical protein ACKKBF_B39080 [Auxenochlorella protothecoides x Auxenochlorella symbiontica]
MKVVALVSGGKDSCFTIMEVTRFGHEVVALANLLPMEEGVDDLDSWMYQTVGHQVVAALGQCMGLPLYRRCIQGTSKDQGLVYQHNACESDEVEDLSCLLAYCKDRIPGLQAVCSGAIASDYQRTRVENVCARLGLVSLAPLWHQPQSTLLRRMIDGGVEAVLVKVAAAGLSVAQDLGAPLAEMEEKLHALRRKFGCNVCGEGGEYETLTLDCPAFTRGRIVLDAWEARVSSADSLAPVAVLHPTAFHVEPKGDAGAAGAACAAAPVVLVPASWRPVGAPATDPVAAAAARDAVHLARDVSLAVRCTGGYLALTVHATPPPQGGPAADAATLHACLAAAGAALEARCPGGWSAALYVHLFVPAMASFAAANAVYGAHLPVVAPPARATVQPRGAGLLVEVLARAGATAAPAPRTLHVQSISPWAPSCIGPYAQAVAHDGLVRFAGQIGLDPGSMGVVRGGLRAQAARCLASCVAVGVAQATRLHAALLCATVFLAEGAGGQGAADPVRVVGDLLAGFLADGRSGWAEDDGTAGGAEGGVGGGPVTGPTAEGGPASAPEGRDGGRLVCASSSSSALVDEAGSMMQTCRASLSEDDKDTGSVPSDAYLEPPQMPRRHWQPLITYITLPQLPRGVLVEIQPTALDSAVLGPEQDSSSSCSSGGEEGASTSWARRLENMDLGSGGPSEIPALAASQCMAQGLASPGRMAQWQVWLPAGAPLTRAGAEALATAARDGLRRSTLKESDLVWARIYAIEVGEAGRWPDVELAGAAVPVIQVARLSLARPSNGRGHALEEAGAVLELWAARGL